MLSDEIKAGHENVYKKTAIVINLYYEDSAEKYLYYILKIPREIDIYFFSSSQKVLIELANKFSEYSNIHIYKKENRGRDISALLVAFKPYVLQYAYICFLHDKKEKYVHLTEDVNFWCENLWGNMIFSEGYIWNAINLMQSRHYGILMPPKPIGEYMDTMYVDSWEKNFDNVVSLAEELRLWITVKREDEYLFAICSAFWCSVDAIKKMFTYDWKYEDFTDEPMPNDGTISHAIERIWAFVALDAGYKVGTIMNCDYAAKLNTIMQKKLEVTYRWMMEKIGVRNTYQLSVLERQKEIVDEIYKQWGKVYLYGAGYFGEIYLKRLQFWGYRPDGFIVSNGKKDLDNYNDYKIYELCELKDFSDTAIIITVGRELKNIVVENLQKVGVENYYILD